MKKNKYKIIILAVVLAVIIVGVVVLVNGLKHKDKEEPFEIYEWENTYGTLTNTEEYTEYDLSYDENNFSVNKVDALQGELRNDFLMAVDASMVSKVLECGGVYYNEQGVEQSIWQILANNGVNCVRFRLWNDYDSVVGVNGGGELTKERILEMAIEARKVNMRFILDFHYSDNWADPEKQELPEAWEGLSFNDLVDNVYTYTKEMVKYFVDRGVPPQIVQIGNEINNGLLWEEGRIVWNDATSYDRCASLLKAGIKGAKEAYKNTSIMIHLAEGGKTTLFESFFDAMEVRNVDYDIIGASFYTFYHGTLDSLKTTLDTISKKYNKKVFVAEFSYAYTKNETEYASNIFGDNQEEQGSYLATIQGQATCIRDTIEVVANIDNNKGIGVCYWEPAWLPVEGAGWAEDGTKATWSNQALFTYNGKALPSLATFKLVRENNQKEVTIEGLKSTEVSYTINIASNLISSSKVPTSVIGLSNFDSYIMFPVEWNASELATAEGNIGTHIVNGVVKEGSRQWDVVASVRTIQNFVKNPGFEEGKTTQFDTPVSLPWVSTTPDYTKIQTNKDYLTGTNDLNYYHTSSFNISFYQEITDLESGTYTLSVWVMGETNSKINELVLYANDYGGEEVTVKMSVAGWANGYKQYFIEGIQITNNRITIGVRGSFSSGTWGHIDDFELVKVE